MGAGYGAGAYFFYHVLTTKRWHEVSVGVVSAAFFALLMLATTSAHYDNFSHGDAPALAATAFSGWTIVSILSPWVVTYLWWRNQRTDPRTPEPGETLVPPTVRLVSRVCALCALAGAAVVLLAPSV